MKKSMKKIGTIMESRLFHEAKKAALEQSIPFHRLIEEAVEKYVREISGEMGKADRGRARANRVSEKSPAYRLESEDRPPLLQPPAAQNSSAAFSIPLEERWKRALGAAGKYRSGRSDISVRHDEFAVDAFAVKE